MSEGPPAAKQFEDVDLPADSRSSSLEWQWNVVGFLVGLLVLAVGFYWEHFRQESVPFFESLEPVDWLLAGSLLAMTAFVVVPLAKDRERTRRYWNRLRRRRFGVTGLVLVSGFFLLGLLGPLFVSEPTRLAFSRAYQPPVWASVDTQYLIGPCVGDVSNGRCYGTWQYPFGTTRTGKDLLPFVVLGARTALSIAAISATLLVPIGLGTGLVAAYSGGTVDDVLMRVAEILQTVPAVIVYLLFWNWNVEYRLLTLIFVFGLTNWGGLARQVRNEALQLRERPYVKAARSAGASKRQVIRWHLLPNISRSVLANVTVQIPLLVLTEAAISFIVLPVPASPRPVTIGDPSIVSWGQIIYLGIRDAGFVPGWWITAIPSAFLILTVVVVNLFGRSLSDVLDPHPGW